MGTVIILGIVGLLIFFFTLGAIEAHREEREKHARATALVPRSAQQSIVEREIPRVMTHEQQTLDPPLTFFTEISGVQLPDSAYRPPDLVVDVASLLPGKQPSDPLYSFQHFLKGLIGIVLLLICLAVAVAILCLVVRGFVGFDDIQGR